MSREIDVERALKDEAYFNSLTSEEQALLRNPAGDASLTEKELDSVAGGLAGPTTSCVRRCKYD